ncbi:MAG: ABC transporter permease [Candidatus Thiodiazotropha sp. (ex Lucinoma kastoroae)]|nr:ABC transporter permease [Candidatus Thiodiazotropha sp. (ex Rostrolucina anterorostrata)]MCU7850251.1 ABC transporter permease [Candidatus Thiodiazotropha sp. (ex Lucinoma kastoroae)]MCU7860863.1 ABC transporter permease [Candidatus Thiodiazotropha sp. (ex Lucinoma kastoroae)]
MLRAIITKELLLLSRDVHAMAVLFIMPVAFILIMSLTLQETMKEDVNSNVHIGLWIESTDDSSAPLIKGLKDLEGFHVNLYMDNQPIEETISKDNLAAAIFVPSGFNENMKKSQIEKESRLQIIHAPTTNYMLRKLLLLSVIKSVASYQFDHLFSSNPGLMGNSDVLKRKIMSEGLIQSTEISPVKGGLTPSSVQQSVPAWLIFSMFFVVIPISTTFLTEKQQGTLQRLKTMPIASGYLLLGKLVPYLIINTIQTLLMFLVGIHVVPLVGGEGLTLGPNAILLLPMSLAVSLSAISFALLIATMVRSTEQATTIGGISNLLLAAVGGIMVPVYVMPGFMQTAAAFSPMNWGLEGFFDILLRQGDLPVLAPAIGKLLLLTLLLLMAAVFRFNRSMD